MALKILKTGVAGAGAMGLGIAQVLGQSGFEVVLFDVSAQQLDKAKAEITKNLETAVSKNKMSAAERDKTLSRITFSNDINALKADFIIEAIV